MALVEVGNPTFASQANTGVGKTIENYLPLQVFNKPIWDEMLYQQSSKWWLPFFLDDKVGVGEPVGANEINWPEDGKWYLKQTLAASAVLSGIGTLQLEIKLKETEQYFIEFDVVDLGVTLPGSSARNLKGRVVAVGTDAGTQTITVDLLTTSGIASGLVAGDFPEDNETSLLYNSLGECWDIRDGRQHAPDEFVNQLTKLENTYESCDDASNREIWFRNSVTGRYYWVEEEEYRVMEYHMKDVCMSILFGDDHVISDPNGAGVAGKGIINFLDSGSVRRSFAGSVVEEDLQDMLSAMSVYSKYNTWHFIVGVDLNADTNKALKEYHQNASVWYGKFNGDEGNKLGINVAEYQFGANRLNMMEFKGFSDPDFLPQNSNSVDYRNFGMLLNLEGDDIQLRYKKRRQGGIMKNWLSTQMGPTFNENGQPVQQRKACQTTNYFTHVGVQVKGLNNHGLLIGT